MNHNIDKSRLEQIFLVLIYASLKETHKEALTYIYDTTHDDFPLYYACTQSYLSLIGANLIPLTDLLEENNIS